MQMMFLLDGVFNFNMINYIKVRFFDYEESAFYSATDAVAYIQQLIYMLEQM